MQARCFSLTVNCDLDKWRGWSPSMDKIRNIRLQEEEAASTLHRHLQGYIAFKRPTRVSAVKKILPGEAHIEAANSEVAIAKYCNKQDTKVEGGLVIELGEIIDISDRSRAGKLAKKMGITYEEGLITLPSVKRMKTSVVEKLIDGTSFMDIVREQPEMLTENMTTLRNNAEAMKKDAKEERMREWANSVTLKPWQQALDTELALKPDGRRITVYIDQEGNTGKSFYIKYKKCMEPLSTLVLSSSKTDNMLYTASKMDDPKYVFLDLYKNMSDHVNYGAIEAIKNGQFMNSKYDSGEIIWSTTPHFVIFTNVALQWDQMIKDRWHVRELVTINNHVQTLNYNIDKECGEKTDVFIGKF